jgi:hypothetical protein
LFGASAALAKLLVGGMRPLLLVGLCGTSAAGSGAPRPASGASLVGGFLGYGLSLTLFVVALRTLGTARTGAYFSVAPWPVIPNQRRLLERAVDRSGSTAEIHPDVALGAMSHGQRSAPNRRSWSPALGAVAKAALRTVGI